MLSSVLLLLAQSASPSQAAPSAPPPQASQEEIIVVGRRAERELAACLARNCPPAEEIETSLQASVEQFADGRYEDARHTLRKAIGRNRAHAAELPGPVSSLYATLATVAEHEGDNKLWRASALNNVRVLRQHLGGSNSATLREELSYADTLVVQGAADEADDAYRRVQRKATESGQPQMAAGAAFRLAWLALIGERYPEAERRADEAVAIAAPNNQVMVELREILRTRIAIRRGDEAAVDALAVRLRQSAVQTPRLLFAPPVEDIQPARTSTESDLTRDSSVRFADVGYWIRPNGRTAEAEVLRNSGLGQWKPGILRQVGARRYIPLDVEPGHPGIYRIDRFTVRGTKGVATGSHIVMRGGRLTVHVVDLTRTEAMSDARRQRTEEASAKPAS